ncbi:serine/threonine-protein phosphatase [Rossellomorea vietnamensis]|uniref:Serine/threonine-protein phosphatase n=1 Tax=Rossellomorea vietnamensis TaxID=218284 RepID=A0A5D4MAA1_9BACI|nr:PP2C family protein-serine/threonine phosphatase [Rossellomorea vietnamensis]TYR98849.1 serine/threonine-protein phosphatase [Rossellomorea vietnamensis]
MYKDKLSISHKDWSKSQDDKTFQREINLARNIQSTLLNGGIPAFEGGEVIGSTVPARLIGGDYYDFYPLLNGKIRIVIGDVMGKGIPAAMLMILTRGAFRSAAASTKGPGENLTAVNKAIYKDLRLLRSFVTLFCADWDPGTSTLTYANAGHNLPLRMDGKTNQVSPVPKASGIMIGGLPDQPYSERTIQLENNDTIFFYTDGIIEAQNGASEQYQLCRLIDTLTQLQKREVSEMEKEVMASIQSFTEGAPQKDDITMVILKVTSEKSDICGFNSPVLTM